MKRNSHSLNETDCANVEDIEDSSNSKEIGRVFKAQKEGEPVVVTSQPRSTENYFENRLARDEFLDPHLHDPTTSKEDDVKTGVVKEVQKAEANGLPCQ